MSDVSDKQDPYILTKEDVRDPPKTIIESLKFLGPGLILSASIVGSGELIATTTLGATAGFVCLWVILVSCFVKVFMQLEWGKHAIHTGETSMLALNTLPGPKFRGTKWPIWLWLILMIFKFMQLGGIVGGVALALWIAFPQLSPEVGALIVAIATSALVFRGHYRFIERVTIIMIFLFVLLTFYAVGVLQTTEYAISWSEIASGLRFELPAYAVAVAVAAFGITGIGGDEIMFYPYWLLEKGYARFTGPKEDSEDWVRRAKGWIRVMYIDAFFSMIIYTVMTVAFYLLGAAVLHRMGTIPSGYETMKTLAYMYTQTIGPHAMWAYLIGGIVVLFSTTFAACASWSRQFTDVFSRMGLLDFYNIKQREKWIAVLAWIMPLLWYVLFMVYKAPVFMVILGGIATSLMLLIVVIAALYFRYRRLDKRLAPSIAYDVFFWTSVIAILILAIYGVYSALFK
ncbi:MAG: Nramp family divalent metal transporter [Archaeoglobi archaeon]|nr:Nramp family divalent metal transporter [Candidatus Mnemosynella sp.]